MKDNHKYLKRFLAFALSVAMVITYMPVNLIAYAETEAPEQPVAEEVVNDTASTEAPAPQEEVKTEEPAPVQEEVTETEPAPVEEPVVTEESSPAEGEQQQAEQPEEVVEETPAEETTEPEKEEFPAQTFNADKGGVKVLVKAPEGALPEGTEMVVTPANTKAVEQAVKDAVDGEVTGFKAVDITFVKDGKDLEPKVPVQVYLNASGLDKAADKSVVHIADNGAASVVEDATVNKAGIAKVETDQFSIYAVVANETSRLNVVFKKGDSEIESVKVKAADLNPDHIAQIVYDPSFDLEKGEVFRGWTTKEEYDSSDVSKGLTIEEVRSEVKAKLGNFNDGDTLTYYAMVFAPSTITYKDPKGVTLHTDSHLVKANDSYDYKINQTYAPEKQDQEFQGWIVDSGSVTPKGSASSPYQLDDVLTVSGDVVLKAQAPEGYWLVFKENGKGVSYTMPQFVETGSTTVKPEDPKRLGYVFGGWFTNEACTGNPFTFGQTLSESTTLYAKWTPEINAPYTVIIWKQNVTGDGYDFEESVNLTGEVGQAISSVTQDGSNVNTGTTPAQVRNVRVNSTEKSYIGFHYDHMDTPPTVAPEGTTVMNVYYNRNTITINFDAGNRYILDEKDNTYKHEVSYQGLYEAPLTFTWPTKYYENSSGTGTAHDTLWQYGGGTVLSFVGSFKLPNPSSVNISMTRANNGQNTRRFYQQNADGTWPAVGDEGAHESIKMTGSSFTITDKYTGFYAYQYSTNGGSTWTNLGKPDSSGDYKTVTAGALEIRFARVKNTIAFFDGAYVDGNGSKSEEPTYVKLKESEEILYGGDVSSYGKGKTNYYVPTHDGYTFSGWYSDKNCTHEYEFTTMPPEGISVYAKWTKTEYRVFLNPNVPEDATHYEGLTSTSFRKAYGDNVGLVNPTTSEYEFIGWYSDEACKTPFNDNYTLNDSTVTTDYDKTRSTERDEYGKDTSSENKDVSRFWITKSLDLYGRWRSKLEGADGIKVEYFADEAEGTVSYEDNALYKDKALATAGPAATPVEGKVFDHWDIQKWSGNAYVSSGKTVLPGATFEVLKANARTETIPSEEQIEGGPTMKYTVRLAAVFKDKEKLTPTQITWNGNGGETSDGKTQIVDDKNRDGEPLKINEDVAVRPSTTFEKEGYVFKGWAKYDGDAKPSSPTDNTKLWLEYRNGKFYEGNNEVNFIAADEKEPIQALYAVWEENEVTINYAVASDSTNMGTVDPASETVKVDTGKATGSTATATSDTYIFDYWTVDDGTESISTDAHYTPAKENGLYVSHTYYAHFKLNKAPVVVHHYLKGTTTKVAEDVTSSEVIGTEYTAQTVTKYQEKDLTVDSYNPSQKVTVAVEGNEITIYYTLPLTIEAKTDSKTYDGTPLAGAYTVTGALDSDSTAINTAIGPAPSITNVADSPKEYQAATAGIPGYYVVTNTKGTLTINPKKVTLTSGDATKAYDGTALTNADVKDKNDNGLTVETGWVGNEGATYTFSGTQTPVGNSKNAFEYTLKEGTQADNYDITKTEGTLTVTENSDKITVVPGSGEKTYDGTALTKTAHDDFKVTGVPEGFTWEATADGTVTNVTPGTGEKAVNAVTSFKILDASGKDVTSQFTNIDKSATGTLKINPKEVTLTSGNATKPYDGKALTNADVKDKNANGLTVETGWVGSEGATYTFSGTQTAVGDSKNAFEYTLKEGTQADNYKITKTEGKLTVTENSDKITVVPGSGEKTYDGTALTKTAHKDFTVTGVPEGFTWEATADGTVTNVTPGTGEKAVNAVTSFKILDASGKDVTNQFANIDKSATGTLKINPRPVTITAESDSKKYDGTALTKDAVTDGYKTFLVEGDVLDAVTVTGSQTTVGSSDNVPSAAVIKNAAGTDVTANYNVTYANGKLTVTKTDKAITITSMDGEWKYDGQQHDKVQYKVTFGPSGESQEVIEGKEGQTEFTLSTGDKITISEAPKVKNVSDTAANNNTFKYVLENADQYETPSTTYGTLTIVPRDVTLSSETATKVYDGTALEKPNVTVGGDGFVEGEATAAAIGTIVQVGNVVNEIAVTTTAAYLEENYNIEKEEGTLTVTPKTVTITADSASKSYDGSALTKDSYTNTELAKGDKIDSVTVTGSQTLVGSSKNVPSKAKIVNAAGEDVTASYEIKYVNGTLTVTDENVPDNKVVTKTDNAEKSYNLGDTVEWTIKVTNIYAEEKTLTVTEQDGVTIVGTVPEKIAAGETIELKATHVITAADVAAGSYKNTVNVKLGDLEKKGDDTVPTDPLALVITAASDSKSYDGEPLTNDGYELTSGELVKGDKIESVKVEGSQTLVGSSENKASDAKIVNAAGEDVTDGYTITYKSGTLTVTDENVPDNKVVNKTDGENNDNTKYHVGDTVTWTITVKNIYAEEKKLTVTEQDGVTIEGTVPETLKPGEEITLTAKHVITAADVAAGSYKNTVTVKLGDLEKKGDDEVDTEPIKISITAASDKKVYDAEPLTNDGYEQTAGELVKGHKIDSVKVEGSQTLVGTSPNKASDAKIVDADGKDVTAGYDVTYIDGTLEVTDGTNPGEDPVDPEKVVKKTDNNSGKTYHVGDTVTWTIWVKNIYDEEKTLTVTEKEGVKLSDYPKTLKAGEEIEITATYVITGPDAEAGEFKNEVTAKLGDLEKPGDDTVDTEQVDIEITAGSDSKVYDGEALTSDKYELSKGELVEGDKIDSVKLTGSQTDVGTNDNIASDAKIVNAAGEDVTKGYNITYKQGTLEVTKRPVTIESSSAKKVYDGTPLTKHAVTVDGFVEGEGLAAVKVTGTQTYVGSSKNTFEYKLFGDSIFRKMLAALNIDDTDAYDPAENGVTKTTKADNYDITVKYGTLEVTDENVDIDDVATKTHEDKEYKLGETVKFTIEVTNIYDEKKTITVKEQEGVTITSDSEFKDVEPGAKVTVTAEYVVTEADLLAGSFSNTATVKFSDVEKPYEPKDDVDVEDPKSHLTVDKKTTSKPANGETYALGETITYEVTATNDGNMTLKNIEVTDELTGDAWTVEELAPGESKTFTAEYTVTEKDIIAGSVKNEATATAEPKDPEAPKPEIVPGTTEDPTDESNPHLTVVKETTSTPANGKEYEVGETVTYEITVTNDGNLTVKDIEVKDDLTGDKWNVESLAPEQSQTFNCEYTITEEDAKNGSVTNIATATGITDDPNHPYPTVVPGEKTVPVVEPADDTKKGVKTGDDNNFGGWLAMMLLAGAGASGLFIRRRREDEE